MPKHRQDQRIYIISFFYSNLHRVYVLGHIEFDITIETWNGDTYLSFFLLGVYNTFVVSTVLQVCQKEFAEVTHGLM